MALFVFGKGLGYRRALWKDLGSGKPMMVSTCLIMVIFLY